MTKKKKKKKKKKKSLPFVFIDQRIRIDSELYNFLQKAE